MARKIVPILIIVLIALVSILIFQQLRMINSRLPFREGILVGKIVFSDGSASDQIGTGCKVQLYNDFIIVSLFQPGTTNTTVSVYNWDQIKSFQLKELP